MKRRRRGGVGKRRRRERNIVRIWKSMSEEVRTEKRIRVVETDSLCFDYIPLVLRKNCLPPAVDERSSNLGLPVIKSGTFL